MRYEYYVHYLGIDRRLDRWVTEQFILIDPEEIHRQETMINKDEEEKSRQLLEELRTVPSAVALNDILTSKEATLQDDPNIDLKTKSKIERDFKKTRDLINEYLQGNGVEGNLLVRMEAAVKAKFGDPPAAE